MTFDIALHVLGVWTDSVQSYATSQPNFPASIHAFNKSGRHLGFLIYDVIRGKTSAAIFEF